jgi:hypothetical protein
MLRKINNKKDEGKKIVIDELSNGLYQVHLQRKNYRINNVIKTLVLRKDFQDFLKKYESECLIAQVGKNIVGKNIKFTGIDFKKASGLVNEYINKIRESKYFQNKSPEWERSFSNIADQIIQQSYLDGYMNTKNEKSIFHNQVLIDDSTNYPNISNMVFVKDIFKKIFSDAFYCSPEKITRKYGSHPHYGSVTFGGGRFTERMKKSGIKPSAPKICQLIFDDTTEKQELLDYIDKNWNYIEESLKSLRPENEKKRITTAGNFLRDVKIYNKYQEFKASGFKNPDIKTYSWLAKDSEYKIQIEPNTIRKIVSNIESEIKVINSEK